MSDDGSDDYIDAGEEQEDSGPVKKESLLHGNDVASLFEFDDDEFYKKWSGPIILGPFIHAFFALLIIVSGQLVLNSWEGTCNYPLDGFISAAVAVCYLFLLVFTWVFLGDTIVVEIPILQVSFTPLTPFRSLKWLMFYYIVLLVISFIVWLVGAVLINLAVFCRDTSPGLYSYAQFIFILYWLVFVISVFYMIKLFFGSNIGKLIKESTKQDTVQDVEMKIFKKKFAEFDVEEVGRIPRSSVPSLLGALGIFVPPEEQESLLDTLDPKTSGEVKYDVFAEWFKRLNDELDENLDDRKLNGDDDDDDDGEK